ncbi:Na/Pi-cotransporter family protein/PhoU family protein [Gottschalkia acidurici 9a]|uniref:Na/Pi-cotransporter family protein/PhoU family protein n=1 Tax=Gottschalkia acidurici (strain ATCC 7906 / DSM 604 / BCRC 14475 / CIP 104303 / KCTC 5404 / NCIMB 10678 / 9a) TaxID=1128398 RepID=K0AZG4_GOTA9|nr:Na/Pi cotransporter family protein [Gottschalkia acidurici]AFS78100.1 Na/Pi-cotransporter family protein/PhoU family protein [Gottschalkia acidurici 9a]
MEIAFGVIGGLGMFLYGMNIMGTGLQKAAGEKLKRLIEILTNNRFMGVLVGALVTMVIQSSSATTVMVVGFVNAGIMTLTQAVGVIMGANVGTTVTAQLIAFNFSQIAPVAIGIGVAILLFSSNKKHKEFAEILIGFGILFVGMDLMSSSLKPLSKSETFRGLLMSLNNPFIGILVGFGLTTMLQSSSASIGLLLALAMEGFINIDMALPILFGDNIGTTTTALISSIGANKTAKKAAFIHFLFNVTGTILFMIVLRKPIQSIVYSFSPSDVQRQIANAHTLFNLTNVIIQFPFAGLLVKAAERVIKGDKEDENQLLKYIDSRIIETPSVALGQVSKEVLRMSKMAEDNLKTASEAFYSKDDKLINKVFDGEKKVNELEQGITEYLVQLSNAPLTDEQHNMVTTLFHAINDIERISDHSENVAELTQYRIDDDLWFTDDAIAELHIMFDRVHELYQNAILAFKTADADIARKVIIEEDEIDIMEKKYRINHIERLNGKSCRLGSGIVYLDIISNLERVADHSANIAQYVLDAVE